MTEIEGEQTEYEVVEQAEGFDKANNVACDWCFLRLTARLGDDGGE